MQKCRIPLISIKSIKTELKTLDMDTFNTDRLIWISSVYTFDLCLILSFSLFLGYSYGIPTNESSLNKLRAKF